MIQWRANLKIAAKTEWQKQMTSGAFSISEIPKYGADPALLMSNSIFRGEQECPIQPHPQAYLILPKE